MGVSHVSIPSKEAQQAPCLLCGGSWDKEQLHILISQSVTHRRQLSTLVLPLFLATQFDKMLGIINQIKNKLFEMLCT